MELLLYSVIFSMILIVSNATNKLVPSLPLPLIQILLGIGWALFVPEENFHLDTELFLALVIGPLLFREAEEAYDRDRGRSPCCARRARWRGV